MRHKKALIGIIFFLSVLSIVATLSSNRFATRKNLSDLGHSPTITSRIGAPVDLQRLTNSASIILVGNVIDLTTVRKNPQGRPDFRVSIVVKKVLKGSVETPNIIMDFTRSSDRLAFTKTITTDMVGILFLNHRPPGGYDLADPSVEALVAVEGEADSRADALDRVINELGNVLGSSTSSDDDKIAAIRALSPINSKSANDALRKVLSGNAGNVEFQAQAALLRHDDIATLRAIEPSLMDRTLKGSIAIPAIAAAIRDGVRSPSALPILTHLLSAPDAEVRRGSVHALREMATVAAWTPLAQALNDTDQMVRYDAVVGLAELSNDSSHAPAFDTFKREEKKYLEYWQAKVSR